MFCPTFWCVLFHLLMADARFLETFLFLTQLSRPQVNTVFHPADITGATARACPTSEPVNIRAPWSECKHYDRDTLLSMMQQNCSVVAAPVCDRLHELGLHSCSSVLPCCVRRHKRKRPFRSGRRKRGQPIAVISLQPFFRCKQNSERQGVNPLNLIEIPLLTRAENSNDVSFALFNARSVGSTDKRSEISEFIVDNNLDFLFLTETWLRPSGDEAKCKDLAPPGFTVCSFPRTSRGGGIAIIYTDVFSPNISCTSVFSFAHGSFELCHVRLTLPQRCLHFFCVYRPPPNRKNKLSDSMFLEQFPDLLELVNTLSGDIVLLGDFNFHFDCPSNPSTSKLLDLLYMFNLSQVVDSPTHSRGHILDWIIVRSDSTYLTSNVVSDALASDHYCVLGSLNVRRPQPPQVFRKVRNNRAIDRTSFGADLLQCLTAASDVTADTLDTCMRSVLDQHAPVTQRKVSSRKSAPWYSAVATDLRAAKQKRRQVERQWRKSGLTVHEQMFAAAKKAVTIIVSKAKSSFFNLKIAACNTSKELYSITDQLLAKVRTSPLPSIFPVSDLPSRFSAYFTNKVQVIRDGLDSQVPVTDTRSASAASCDSQFQAVFSAFKPVSEGDVRQLIQKMTPKSCELDPIPTTLMFDCLDSVLPFVTHVINDSLTSGVFPSLHKKAVKPLLKKPSLDQNELMNYRPVSNLPFLSKVIEKLVLSQLLDHISSNGLMDPFQSAYRMCHSTETALLRILNDLLLALDDGKVSMLALLDLSSAFDTIDHDTLIDRLRVVFGIDGTVLSWFRSYLSERSQTVSVDGHLSDPADLRFGVPQGSVLGPVLFLLYVQPLSAIIDRHSVSHHAYSDDTQLYKSGSVAQVSGIIQSVTQCIADVRCWMSENRLKLNEGKTEAMLIASPRVLASTVLPEHVTIDDTRIRFSSSVKNLGVTIENDLSLNKHVLNTCRAAYLELRRISSIRHLLTLEATKTLACAFILSRLDYANSLLSGCPQYLLDRLQRVQNSAARLIVGAKRTDHVTPILRSLHWLPIRDRIQHKTLSICHTSLSGTGPSYLPELLHFYTPSRQLRSSSDTRTLRIPSVRTKAYGQRSFSFQCPSLWNTLPKTVRYVEGTASFKRQLKTYFFRNVDCQQ
eukprot:TRINITY_DN439_c0_g1_i27.p1 TRINITY_DN439_c0_g1~~TRINITY_DN439_c0_g1_i27.p1  ORF type:complete len:1128 (+),score=135.82 TRINITY_DN439_c0_g1_i27:139-3522(+)